MTHCKGTLSWECSFWAVPLLSSEKLGMGLWDALQAPGAVPTSPRAGGQGLEGTVRQVQRAPPSGRIWDTLGPAGSHSSSTAFSAQSSAPHAACLRQKLCRSLNASPGLLS